MAVNKKVVWQITFKVHQDLPWNPDARDRAELRTNVTEALSSKPYEYTLTDLSIKKIKLNDNVRTGDV